MDEFDEWYADNADYTLGYIESVPAQREIIARRAWLESARRADRKARGECCEIVRAERIANECACESDDAYNMALTHAEQAIRATMKEE